MTSLAPLCAPRRRLRILRRPSESVHPATPRPQRRDCHGRLITALIAVCGEGSTLVDASFKAWCSATFIGARHELALRITGDPTRARALADHLSEADLPIPGHIVADLCVDHVIGDADGTTRIDLSVLTIEDW